MTFNNCETNMFVVADAEVENYFGQCKTSHATIRRRMQLIFCGYICYVGVPRRMSISLFLPFGAVTKGSVEATY
jgi:hypothetical protein